MAATNVILLLVAVLPILCCSAYQIHMGLRTASGVDVNVPTSKEVSVTEGAKRKLWCTLDHSDRDWRLCIWLLPQNNYEGCILVENGPSTCPEQVFKEFDKCMGSEPGRMGPSHEGTWTCVLNIVDNSATAQNVSASVWLVRPVSLDTDMSHLTLRPGDSQVVTCHTRAPGYPTPKVTWTIASGRPLTNVTDRTECTEATPTQPQMCSTVSVLHYKAEKDDRDLRCRSTQTDSFGESSNAEARIVVDIVSQYDTPLTTGAKVGIALAVVLLILVIVLLIVAFCCGWLCFAGKGHSRKDEVVLSVNDEPSSTALDNNVSDKLEYDVTFYQPQIPRYSSSIDKSYNYAKEALPRAPPPPPMLYDKFDPYSSEEDEPLIYNWEGRGSLSSAGSLSSLGSASHVDDLDLSAHLQLLGIEDQDEYWDTSSDSDLPVFELDDDIFLSHTTPSTLDRNESWV